MTKNIPYAEENVKPWGYELILTSRNLPYTAKIIRIKADHRLSLQLHDKKIETLTLISGKANLIIDNNRDELETIRMDLNKGYTVYVGQRHRLQAVTDCEIYEASTPEIGTTYRIEDDYNRPNETEDLRARERK